MIERYEINGEITTLFIPHKGTMMEAYIDTEDLQRVLKFSRYWSISINKEHPKGYVVKTVYDPAIKTTRTQVRLHKFILNYKGKNKVDHINHNGLDNRKCNLRIVTVEDNSRNREKKNINNKSGYRNVFYDKRIDRYVVQLQVNGKNTRFGSYKDVDEAGRIAKDMRHKYYGEFAGGDN